MSMYKFRASRRYMLGKEQADSIGSSVRCRGHDYVPRIEVRTDAEGTMSGSFSLRVYACSNIRLRKLWHGAGKSCELDQGDGTRAMHAPFRMEVPSSQTRGLSCERVSNLEYGDDYETNNAPSHSTMH
jgi:hypothetical protein